jgi:hypothetical protein
MEEAQRMSNCSKKERQSEGSIFKDVTQTVLGQSERSPLNVIAGSKGDLLGR